jgi:hypothetical protein
MRFGTEQSLLETRGFQQARKGDVGPDVTVAE